MTKTNTDTRPDDSGRLLTNPTPRDQAMIDVARAHRLGEISSADRYRRLADITARYGRRS